MNEKLLELVNRKYNGVLAYGLPEQEIVSTGIPQLDAAMGGGIPKGRIVEIYGPEDSGKTGLALHLAQQLPGPTLYIDADHGLSPFILSGREVYLLNVTILEDAPDACLTAAAGFGSIVIDSLAALPTDVDMRNSINDGYWGQRERQAKVTSKALPILSPVLHKTGCTLILVNQLRVKPGIMYGNPERPTGGKAVGYYSALRLETRRYEICKSGPEVFGQMMRVRVAKCKYAAPGKEALAKLTYGAGVSA